MWDGLATVRVEDGERIELDPAPDVDRAGLRAVLLGPVFSLVLLQRGRLPLHASGIVFGGEVVAFCADSGVGKSTLALSLVDRGHGLFSDDVVALTVEGSEVIAYPGFPQQKLMPDALAHTGRDWTRLPRVNATEIKRTRRVEGPFDTRPRKLRRVVVVEDGSRAIEGPLVGHEALMLLFHHLHRPELLSRAVGPSRLLQGCAELAERVPVLRLRRERDLAALEDVARMVEEAFEA